MRYWITDLNKEYEDSKLSWFCKPSVTKESFDKVVAFLKEKGVTVKISKKENSYRNNEVTSTHELAMLLHEAGHAIYKHEPAWNTELKKIVLSENEVLEQEIQAWDKGFEIMKNLNIRCGNYSYCADECLETYQ